MKVALLQRRGCAGNACRRDGSDGLPGTLVEVGERRVEVARRTDSHVLRVRDPQAPTRLGFTGVPTFPVEERWVVPARFEAYDEPRRITVGAVVDGLTHRPTARSPSTSTGSSTLPCAFTEHATCPLPPARKVLTVAVEAGEQLPN